MHTTFSRRTYWFCRKFYTNYKDIDTEDRQRVDFEQANLVSSLLENGRHAPALDLDWTSVLEGNKLIIWYDVIFLLLEEEIIWSIKNIRQLGFAIEVNLFSETHPKYRVELTLAAPAVLLESKTPNHFHLYVDMEMDWGDYQLLLSCLTCLGILETGFFNAAIAREMTMLRKLPISGQQVIVEEKSQKGK